MQQHSTADPFRDAKSIKLDYRHALAELTFNSKPIINKLTILAQEHAALSSAIVQIIVEHFDKSPYKLPTLYLIDSICKNLPPSTLYVKLFGPVVTKLFAQGYFAVDDNIKKDFLRVLQTWHSVFDRDIVKRIEESIFKKPPPGASSSQSEAHRQPLNKVEPDRNGSTARHEEARQGQRHDSRERVRPRRESSREDEARHREREREREWELREREREFRERHRGPDDRESDRDRNRIRDRDRYRDHHRHEQQDRDWDRDRHPPRRNSREFSEPNRMRSDMPPSHHPHAPMSFPSYTMSPSQVPHAAPHFGNGSGGMPYYSAPLSMPLPPVAPLMHAARPLTATASRDDYLFRSPSEALVSKKRQMEQDAASDPRPLKMNTAKDTTSSDPLALLTELQSFLETQQLTDASNPIATTAAPLTPLPFPVIELSYASIQKRFPDNFVYLYAPYRPLQCQNCGFRYEDTPKGRAALSFHLDCHFKRNRRLNERGKKIFSRDWFLREPDWIASISNPEASSEAAEKLVPGFFGDNTEAEKAGQDGSEEPNRALRNAKLAELIPVGSVASTCAVCGDAFDTKFDAESEEWSLVDACRLKSDTKKALHVDCLDHDE